MAEQQGRVDRLQGSSSSGTRRWPALFQRLLSSSVTRLRLRHDAFSRRVSELRKTKRSYVATDQIAADEVTNDRAG